jgi:hypothetical protein
MMSDGSLVPLLAAAGAIVVAGLAAAVAVVVEEEEVDRLSLAAEAITNSVLALRKRQRPDNQEPVKRRFILWDRSRAGACIMADYLGILPRFCLDDFKRIFRVSRSTYEELKNIVCATNVFFRERLDAANRLSISTDAKLLIALKYLAYGTCVNAFRDYFQMGESTAMASVKHFIKAVRSELCSKFFHPMSPADAKRVEELHHKQHGVRGMIGSLDCSHFVWGNCPVAYHGQYQGKEGRPTVVVEAVADYNLYAWHAVFGYCGTLNDINIWDSSLLQKSICDGTFGVNDFPFVISGETFEELWLLVDGIYPALSRFVKPLSVPLTADEALFSMWQESKRKDIECFFGVFKKKFHLFARPIMLRNETEIVDAFYCCLILHNIAVAERIRLDDGSIESDGFYEVVDTNDDEEVLPNRENVEALRFVELEEDDVRNRLFEVQYLEALGIIVHDSTLGLCAERVRLLPQLTRMVEYRWNKLYDIKGHRRLIAAIARELLEQYNAYKRAKNS